jgi:hypothetical protein
MDNKKQAVRIREVAKKALRFTLLGLGFYTLCNDISALFGWTDVIHYSGVGKYLTILGFILLFVVFDRLPKSVENKNHYSD